MPSPTCSSCGACRSTSAPTTVQSSSPRPCRHGFRPSAPEPPTFRDRMLSTRGGRSANERFRSRRSPLKAPWFVSSLVCSTLVGGRVLEVLTGQPERLAIRARRPAAPGSARSSDAYAPGSRGRSVSLAGRPLRWDPLGSRQALDPATAAAMPFQLFRSVGHERCSMERLDFAPCSASSQAWASATPSRPPRALPGSAAARSTATWPTSGKSRPGALARPGAPAGGSLQRGRNADPGLGADAAAAPPRRRHKASSPTLLRPRLKPSVNRSDRHGLRGRPTGG